MIAIFKRIPKFQIIILSFVWSIIGIMIFFSNNDNIIDLKLSNIFNWHYQLNFVSLILIKIVIFFLIGLNALYISYILIINKLVNRNNLLGTLIYLIFFLLVADKVEIYTLLILNFSQILIFQISLRLDEIYSSINNLFALSLLISITSFIFAPSIIFILFLFSSIIVFRRFEWRGWIIIVLGILVAYFYILTIYYLNDNLLIAIQELNYYFLNNFKLNNIKSIDYSTLLWFSVILIILSIIIFRIIKISKDTMNENRNKFFISIPFLLISFFSYFFIDINSFLFKTTLFVPFSIVLTIGLTNFKYELLANVYFYIILFITLFFKLNEYFVWL